MTVRVEHLLRALRDEGDSYGAAIAHLAEQYAKEDAFNGALGLPPHIVNDTVAVPRELLKRLFRNFDSEDPNSDRRWTDALTELRALLEGK